VRDVKVQMCLHEMVHAVLAPSADSLAEGVRFLDSRVAVDQRFVRWRRDQRPRTGPSLLHPLNHPKQLQSLAYGNRSLRFSCLLEAVEAVEAVELRAWQNHNSPFRMMAHMMPDSHARYHPRMQCEQQEAEGGLRAERRGGRRLQRSWSPVLCVSAAIHATTQQGVASVSG
jgi:hypothetical protein